MREMQTKVGKEGGRLKLNGVVWSVAACLFAGDSVPCRVKANFKE